MEADDVSHERFIKAALVISFFIFNHSPTSSWPINHFFSKSNQNSRVYVLSAGYKLAADT